MALLIVAVDQDDLNRPGGEPGRLRELETIGSDLSGLETTLTIENSE